MTLHDADYRIFFAGGPPEDELPALTDAVEAAASRLGLERTHSGWIPFGRFVYRDTYADENSRMEMRYYDLTDGDSGYHHYELRAAGDTMVRDVLADEAGQELRRTGLTGPIQDREEALRDVYQELVAQS